MAYYHDLNDMPTSEDFNKSVSTLIIGFVNSYLFLPIWFLVVIGFEFSSGHVSKVITFSNRLSYIKAKLFYTLSIVVITACFSMIAYYFSYLVTGFTVYNYTILVFKFLQFLIVYGINALLLLSLVLVVQAPGKSFGIYIAISFVEPLISLPIEKGLNIDPFFLPNRFMSLLYIKRGNRMDLENYYNPISENLTLVVLSVAAAGAIFYLGCRYFLKKDLKVLSDQLLLIAITGSSLAAKAAGIMPETVPIIADTPSPSTIFLNDSATSRLPIGINVISTTSIRPPKPPITLRKIDSNKN